MFIYLFIGALVALYVLYYNGEELSEYHWVASSCALCVIMVAWPFLIIGSQFYDGK